MQQGFMERDNNLISMALLYNLNLVLATGLLGRLD